MASNREIEIARNAIQSVKDEIDASRSVIGALKYAQECEQDPEYTKGFTARIKELQDANGFLDDRLFDFECKLNSLERSPITIMQRAENVYDAVVRELSRKPKVCEVSKENEKQGGIAHLMSLRKA